MPLCSPHILSHWPCQQIQGPSPQSKFPWHEASWKFMKHVWDNYGMAEFMTVSLNFGSILLLCFVVPVEVPASIFIHKRACGAHMRTLYFFTSFWSPQLNLACPVRKAPPWKSTTPFGSFGPFLPAKFPRLRQYLDASWTRRRKQSSHTAILPEQKLSHSCLMGYRKLSRYSGSGVLSC